MISQAIVPPANINGCTDIYNLDGQSLHTSQPLYELIAITWQPFLSCVITHSQSSLFNLTESNDKIKIMLHTLLDKSRFRKR